MIFKEFYLYLLPPCLGFIVFTALAIVALFHGGRRSINVLFAALCFMAALSSLREIAVGVINRSPLALSIDRLFYCIFVFSLPLYIRFIHDFLGVKGLRWLEGMVLVFSSALSVLTWSDIFVSSLKPYSFGQIEVPGPVYHLFILGSSFTALYCMIALIRAHQCSLSSQHRNRIKYILGGLGVFTVFLLTHYLPANGIMIYPLTGISFIPGLVLAIGVLKYDLLDAGVIVRRGVTYLTLTAVLAGVYIFFIYAVHILFIQSNHTTTIIQPLVFAALIVLIFDPLRKRIQSLIDRFILKGKYDYRQVLQDLSGKMTFYCHLDEIGDALRHAITSTMGIESIHFFVRDGIGEPYREYKEQGKDGQRVLMIDDPLIAYLRCNLHPLTLAMIRKLKQDVREAIGKSFNRFDCSVIIPLPSMNDLAGFITVGEKQSGELFLQEDIALLTTIGNQAAVAVENAKNYLEIEELNRDLERRIKQRTAELAKALEEKDHTRDRLIRSESLAAIGQLVAGTAHEMNNPISSASSLIQMSIDSIAREKNPDHAELLDDLQFSLKELSRTKAIIDSLLSLSRQGGNYMELVDIHAVIDDALRVLYNQYKHAGIEFNKVFSVGIPRMEGNFASLGQLFINLIKNAIQALPEHKGIITISTECDVPSKMLKVRLQDDGIGIPAHLMKDIFKPFFTTKPAGQGTGLGLYIVHEIVKKHDGEIHINNDPEGGTRVDIEFPLIRRLTALTAERAESSTADVENQQ